MNSSGEIEASANSPWTLAEVEKRIQKIEGLPALPKVELLLYKSSGATSKAATALHDYLAHYLRLHEQLGENGIPIGLP